MYNAKIIKFQDSIQTRLYASPFRSGDEIISAREEKKLSQFEKRKLELDIMKYYGHSLPDFILEEDYLSMSDSKYSLWSQERKDKFIKTIASNRSKCAIYDISRANKWDFFITLTFKRGDFDTTDYNICMKKVTKWLNNMRTKAPDLKYMIVPELHKDGKNYHFHGLLANIGNLKVIFSGHYTDKGDPIYNLGDYKLGFTEATKVKDTDKVSAYVTKYITKELESHIKGKRRYLASQNCLRSEVKDLFLDPEDQLDFLVDLKNIVYMNTKTNAYNTVSYIEQKL